jgi:hypothetical protein
VHHRAAVHGGQRSGQLHGQLGQLVGPERLRQLGEARATRVLHHDRVAVLRRVHQLRHAVGAAQPLEHPDLVPESALRVRSQRLLADDRPPAEREPGHARAVAGVHDRDGGGGHQISRR